MKVSNDIYNKVWKASLPLSVFLFAFLFGACDHIAEDEQLIKVEKVIPPTPEDDPEKPTAATRNILIEDFTGQKCVNCPDGTKIIDQLQEAYPDRIIAVGIYSGPFGKTPTGGLLPLSTQMGCDYYDHWKIPSQPYGMVSRGEPISHTQWMTAVNNEIGFISEIKMDIEAVLKAKNINITVKEKSLGGGFDGKVQVWVLEDGIVGVQYMPDGSINKEYIHNHVFRTAVNGMWGEDVAIGQEESKSQSYAQAVDDAWNTENLSIVAFIYNSDGVEQAAKVKVKNEE